MKRLLYVMPFTRDIEGMKQFYGDAIGLEAKNATPFFVRFSGGRQGASFALLAITDQQDREIELCFESDDVDADVNALRKRGVEFLNEPKMQSFGKVAHLRDPEGHLISLLEPSPGIGAARAPETSPANPEWQRGVAGALAAGSGGTALATAVANPRFSTAIIGCEDLPALRTFYREKLGLRIETESPLWVAFSAGGSIIALRPRAKSGDRARAKRITLGFTVGDLMGWADEARDRGVHFESAPSDHGFGLVADAADPDGNDLTFREPPGPPMLEEELAEEFEDDQSPTRASIRKPVKKGVHAVSRVAVKPEYKTPARAPRTRKAVKGKLEGKKVPSIRGAGPERTRAMPKNLDDIKRPKLRQGVGRLKKAERRTLAEKKRAVASVSKSKPVKHRAATSPARKKR